MYVSYVHMDEMVHTRINGYISGIAAFYYICLQFKDYNQILKFYIL